ncbi:hypothetical protein [Jannaschia sp. R86511]|uniref:hypothetical protein n=1 Tax=Jannaschia sp. R86511 TaxID=3093853 RepID=UPI0036D285B0
MDAAGIDGTTGLDRGADEAGRRPGGRDRARIWWAVLRLDGWQTWYAVPGRTGRAMRQELAANLRDAAGSAGGVAAAVHRLGGLRELAREAAFDDGRPGWERGAMAAVVAFTLVLLVQLLLSFVYVDGLLSAGGGQGVLLGNEVSAREDADSLTVATGLGGWALLVVPVVFVLVARPWRLLRRAPAG